MEIIVSVGVLLVLVEIFDEYYYFDFDYFVVYYDYYDFVLCDGCKIFIGEFVMIVNCGKGNLCVVVGEVVFFFGFECNFDFVWMVSYVFLFKNVFYFDFWNLDVIVFDIY